MVEFTTDSEVFLMIYKNSLARKKPSKISLKIRVREAWLGSGRQRILKCLVNLGVS